MAELTPAPVAPPVNDGTLPSAAPPSAGARAPRMVIQASASTGAVGGTGSAVVIAFFWNSVYGPRHSLPQMDLGTAGAVAITLAPLFMGIEWLIKWAFSWLPMREVQNRRT